MDGSSLLSLLEGMGLPQVDLSSVENPKGRVDFLASNLIAQGVKAYAPELQALHGVVRPFIDGQLHRHLSKVKLPGIAAKKTRRKTK